MSNMELAECINGWIGLIMFCVGFIVGSYHERGCKK